MTNLERARLELNESQLLTIKNQIKRWRTRDQVINMMRSRYSRPVDQSV